MPRAVLLTEDGDVRVVDVTNPAPGDRGVRVSIDLATICGRDRAAVATALAGAATGPVLLGHEAVGTVREVGVAVEGVQVGDRVAVTARRRCGTCGPCRRGGSCAAAGHADPTLDRASVARLDGVGALAEEIVTEVDRLQPLPDGMPPAHAVAAACSGPVGVAAIRTLASVWPNEVVVVLGCGGVGTLAVQAAVAAGARTIIAVDPVTGRREAAAATHDTVVAAAPDAVIPAITAATDGGGADHVIVCAPGPGLVAEAVELSRPGGTVVVVGGDGPGATPALPWSQLVHAGRRVIGGDWGGALPAEDIPRLLELAVDRHVDLDAVASEVEGGLDAVADLLADTTGVPRPVLRP